MKKFIRFAYLAVNHVGYHGSAIECFRQACKDLGIPIEKVTMKNKKIHPDARFWSQPEKCIYYAINEEHLNMIKLAVTEENFNEIFFEDNVHKVFIC